MKYHKYYTTTFSKEHLNFDVEIFYALHIKHIKNATFINFRNIFLKLNRVQDGFNFHFTKTCLPQKFITKRTCDHFSNQ